MKLRRLFTFDFRHIAQTIFDLWGKQMTGRQKVSVEPTNHTLDKKLFMADGDKRMLDKQIAKKYFRGLVHHGDLDLLPVD